MPAMFYIIALITIVCAIGAVSLRNLVHCALCLALSFIGMAAFFLQLNAAFVAFAQILVYVGAVAILVVFAILLTRNAETTTEKRSSVLALGLPLTCLMIGVLIYSIFGTKIDDNAIRAVPPTVIQLGQSLLTSHVVALELIGLLLTIALLGAIVLALPEKPTESMKGQEE